jgi:hypothetical protein
MKRLLPALVALSIIVCGVPKARAGGTHFLVEPYTGVVFNQGFNKENAVGLESGAMLAIGGKLKGFPPRFYLYFRASQTYFGEDDVTTTSQGTGCVQRSYTAVMGGLRVVIPLWSHLRLNLEVGGGSLFSQNRYSEVGYRVQYPEDLIAVEFGAGLNWRLFRWLSVGIMYDYTFVAEDEHGDLIATILGEADFGSSLGWSRLVATVGFHF